MAQSKSVVAVREGPIGVLRLNRPARRNAINGEMLGAMERALERFARDENVRVILLEGAGDGFCSGFDLGEDYGDPNRSLAEWRALLARDLELMLGLWSHPKPTIAALHGFAIAGGFELAICCDLTIASAETRLGLPEIRFGSGFVALVLPWLTGAKAAKELMLIGDDQLPAERARELGLLNEVAPPGAAAARAREIARTLASMDPSKVSLIKGAINDAMNAMGMESALRAALAQAIEIEALQTEDGRQFREVLARDGVRAAIAWRKSRFQP